MIKTSLISPIPWLHPGIGLYLNSWQATGDWNITFLLIYISRRNLAPDLEDISSSYNLRLSGSRRDLTYISRNWSNEKILSEARRIAASFSSISKDKSLFSLLY